MTSKKVRINMPLTVRELALALGLEVSLVVRLLFERRVMRTVDTIVELEIARNLALDLGYELTDDG
jgi:transcriptional regulator with XRE-family HTH domain